MGNKVGKNYTPISTKIYKGDTDDQAGVSIDLVYKDKKVYVNLGDLRPLLGRETFVGIDNKLGTYKYLTSDSARKTQNSANKWTNEAIVVSGDHTEGYAIRQFIEPSIKQIYDWKQSGKSNITWIVANEGYKKSDLEKTGSKLGVKMVFVDNKDQLINYFNSGEDRQKVKITDVSVFSHGLRDGTLALGYKENDDLNISIEQLKNSNINSNAFYNTNTWFASCNTGTQANGTSFAQEWVNKTSGSAMAVVDGKTDYEHINEGRSNKWYSDDRMRRWLGIGYDEGGSLSYPIPSTGINWYKFTSNKLPSVEK